MSLKTGKHKVTIVAICPYCLKENAEVTIVMPDGSWRRVVSWNQGCSITTEPIVKTRHYQAAEVPYMMVQCCPFLVKAPEGLRGYFDALYAKRIEMEYGIEWE
jgi:hypothetical protein